MGINSRGSKGIPIKMVRNAEKIGAVAPMISAKDALQYSRALLFEAKERAIVAEMGTILKKNSETVGTTTGVPKSILCLSITAKPTPADDSMCMNITKAGYLNPCAMYSHLTESIIVERAYKYMVTQNMTRSPFCQKNRTIVIAVPIMVIM
mmetsp:Transcript_77311/g.214923  ORF Transcript_77311/g.214923 Transcript_77311/m.214923 type:complete len:151 (+) Transcript_77311:739-1191(+)